VAGAKRRAAAWTSRPTVKVPSGLKGPSAPSGLVSRTTRAGRIRAWGSSAPSSDGQPQKRMSTITRSTVAASPSRNATTKVAAPRSEMKPARAGPTITFAPCRAS
jgi:hypothetical protein